MISVVCPGQGSQTPGFLEGWLEIPEFKVQMDRSSEILGLDLIDYGTNADAETIRDTKIAQPLIVAAGIASYLVLQERFGNQLAIKATAGHSVGEITAAYVSGIFDDATALRFVQKRGNEMAEAAGLTESSMAAVVGGEPEDVLDHLDSIGLFAANFNGKGQIVAAGATAKIKQLIENPPKGTRVVGLSVAGAFHTSFMQPALAPLEEFSKNLAVNPPKIDVFTNSDGSLVSSGQRYLELLISQVSNPVRWDLTMQSLSSKGTTVLIELLPGGTLSGIAKRAMPNTVAIPLKTPADLDKVAEVIGK